MFLARKRSGYEEEYHHTDLGVHWRGTLNTEERRETQDYTNITISYRLQHPWWVPIVWFCWRCAQPLKAWKVQGQGVTGGLTITGQYNHVTCSWSLVWPNSWPVTQLQANSLTVPVQILQSASRQNSPCNKILTCWMFMDNHNNTLSFLLPTARSSGTTVPWGTRLNVPRFGNRLWSKSNPTPVYSSGDPLSLFIFSSPLWFSKITCL